MSTVETGQEPRIFLSYRREDSAAYAGRLYDDLVGRFGYDNVFIDINSIEPGVDFAEAVETTVAKCDTVLVLIGPRWLSASAGDGTRRIESSDDFVRLEIERALSSGTPRIIPVLVGGARIPETAELPESLGFLTRRQAFELSDHRWSFDVGVLCDRIGKSTSDRPTEPKFVSTTTQSTIHRSENLVVMFTDLDGAGELWRRLSHEAAGEVRRKHFSTLRQALAEAGGTEVKNLGDGLMIVFGSASAALGCAVSMQQGVERANRGRQYSAGLRIGLSQGEVTEEDSNIFGDPVVEASRLCGICEIGQILAADVVRLMAGRRSRHQYRSLGELNLDRGSDPIETFEVLWEPIGVVDAGTVIPLPQRLRLSPTFGVVGRDAEFQSLTDATKRVVDGEGREVLLISGEAGMGKTTLVAEAARAAFDSGACVLLGHCEEDLVTPYQLFAEALGHYVLHATDEQLFAHVEAHGSELGRLVPALVSRVPNLPPSKATDSDTERYLLFAAVVGLLATASELQPVILVLDDLQWADVESLQLLRHLTAAERAMRVLVLGTYRPNELSQARTLRETLGVLRRYGGVTRIELTGLDDRGVASLLEAVAGHPLDDAGLGLAEAVNRETDGNPFFVREVLRHLSDTGAIYRDVTGKWVADGSVEQLALPDSVREVIGGRVVRLGKDAERVLSVAAVIGRDFDLDLLARATKVPEDDLLDVLDAAAAVALVREVPDTGHYNFAHALIQHTLYEDLGPNRRARTHKQVAEALESLCGDRPGNRVGELARHWFNATQPIDLAKAINYARQAGDAALSALAPGEALRYYAQALDLYPQVSDPDPVLGIDLAIGLGTAQRQTGDPRFRETLLGAARRAADFGDIDRLVAAALANDRGTFSTVNAIDTAKVEILETALARISTDHPDRALVLSALCSQLTIGSSLERRQALGDEAVAIAEASGDDAIIARVLNDIGIPLGVPSLLDQSLARSAEALARAQRVGDPVLLCSAASARRRTAGCAGDIAEMDRCLEIKAPLVEQLGQPYLTWIHTLQRATRALVAGEAGQAELLVTEGFQIGSDGGQPDAAIVFGAQMIMVSWWRGTMGGLVPLIEQTITDNPGLPVFVAVLALAHAEGDRSDEVRRLLKDFAEEKFDLPLDTTWLTGMVAYAEAAIQCRDPLFAGPIFERLAPFADQWLYTDLTTSGPVSRSLGGLAAVLGRYDEADAFFSTSAASSGRAEAKFFVAQTDLLWGMMLADRRAPGDIEKARDLLTRARSVAASNGYGIVELRAASRLQMLDP
jgi:class 3 adenylate cyclase